MEYRFLYLACEQDCVVDVPSVYHHPWMHDTSRILGTQVIQTASDRSSMSSGRSRKCTDMNQSLHQSISIFINKITLKVASTHEPPHETHQEESVVTVVRVKMHKMAEFIMVDTTIQRSLSRCDQI